MALGMRRIFSVIVVVALMAVMLAAMAAPGFAKAIHLSGPSVVGGVPCEATAVITPSDNTNFQCKIKSEGGNSGGSGGGGATTEEGTITVPNAKREQVPARGHAVETPGGNVILHGHYNPDKA